MSTSERLLRKARDFVATMFEAQRRADLAILVRNGAGDDFPEVLAAVALLQDLSDGSAYREEALRAYADAEFWDEDLPGGSLASHDRGTMARNVMAGLPPLFNCE